MKNLELLLNDLERTIPSYELENPAVSKGTVGWHIEHSLLTLNVIINAVKTSDPGNYKWAFNWRRTLIATTGKIPRGRVKAPSVVQPIAKFTEDTLKEHMALAKSNLNSLKDVEANHFFKHPFFGNLNVKPTLRFLQIHTAHHLAIINDIIKSRK